jgi:hypothetical protein
VVGAGEQQPPVDPQRVGDGSASAEQLTGDALPNLGEHLVRQRDQVPTIDRDQRVRETGPDTGGVRSTNCQLAIEQARALFSVSCGGGSEQLRSRLTDVYAEVADAAPKALIVVTGYPYLFNFPPSMRTEPSLTTFPPSMRTEPSLTRLAA